MHSAKNNHCVMRKQSWSALRPALGICRKKGAEWPYEGYTLGSGKWRGLREENGVGSSPVSEGNVSKTNHDYRVDPFSASDTLILKRNMGVWSFHRDGHLVTS